MSNYHEISSVASRYVEAYRLFPNLEHDLELIKQINVDVYNALSILAFSQDTNVIKLIHGIAHDLELGKRKLKPVTQSKAASLKDGYTDLTTFGIGPCSVLHIDDKTIAHSMIAPTQLEWLAQELGQNTPKMSNGAKIIIKAFYGVPYDIEASHITILPGENWS